jgi:hypothetical protein
MPTIAYGKDKELLRQKTTAEKDTQRINAISKTKCTLNAKLFTPK